MLGKIQSTEFIKKLFDNIEEKTRLKLVKYNKELKKKLEINIDTFKEISGKYIVYK